MNPLSHIETRLARIENSLNRLGVLVECTHSQVHLLSSTPSHTDSDGSSADEPEDTGPEYQVQVAPAG